MCDDAVDDGASKIHVMLAVMQSWCQAPRDRKEMAAAAGPGLLEEVLGADIGYMGNEGPLTL